MNEQDTNPGFTLVYFIYNIYRSYRKKKKKLSHKGYSIAKPQRSSDLRADGSRHEGHGAEGGPSIRPGAGSWHGRLDPSAGSS